MANNENQHKSPWISLSVSLKKKMDYESSVASREDLPLSSVREDSYVRFKLCYNTEVRVARLKRNDKHLASLKAFQDFVVLNFAVITDIYQRVSWRNAPRLLLKYADEDENHVLQNDEDLLSALRQSVAQFSVLKIVVELEGHGSNSSRPMSTMPFLEWRRDENLRRTVVSSGRTSSQACRHFLAGYCKYDSTCKFSHDTNSSSKKTRQFSSASSRHPTLREAHKRDLQVDARDIQSWIEKQLKFSAAENIDRLSSDEGRQMIDTVVQQRSLPDYTINIFVNLLVKDEIRSSLLRHKTNSIYGALLGSSFLLQLHGHILSHLGSRPRLQDVRPYVWLVEELQLRTADGWKVVPIDALKIAVGKLDPCNDKDELVATVSRLLDQRDKIQLQLAIAPPDKSLLGAEFRFLPIIPSKEELLSTGSKEVPINRVNLRYTTLCEYLETHFQLLREDCIEPLKQGIRSYRREPDKRNIRNKNLDLRLYHGVNVLGVRCGEYGTEHRVSFTCSRLKVGVQWESSKRLLLGALLCISCDEFETVCWAVVAHRDVKDLEKGQVDVRVVGNRLNPVEILRRGQTYVMAESSVSYFDAYFHVLKSLQRSDMENLPFTKYLLQLERVTDPPLYLMRREKLDSYDLSYAFPNIKTEMGKTHIRLLQHPPSSVDSIDISQWEALIHGLTKELAIIQGPPGTGKTFLGLLLVKLFLGNLTQKSFRDSVHATNSYRMLTAGTEKMSDLSGPILVICYTNHALDQFLEGIYKYEANLIRMGGRSKSDKLANCNLNKLLKEQREGRTIDTPHHRAATSARRNKSDLEDRIHQCIDAMGEQYVTAEALKDVATDEQIRSLFFSIFGGKASQEKITELWLAGFGTAQMTTNDEASTSEFVEHVLFTEDGNDEVQPMLFGYQPAETGRRGKVKLFPQQSVDDVGWQTVNRRARNVHRMNAPANGQMQGVRDRLQAPNDHAVQLIDVIDSPNLWALDLSSRQTLHDYWLEEIRSKCRQSIQKLSADYEKACEVDREVDQEIQLFLLRTAKIVGMTTSAAAKYGNILRALKSEIVIVEEAAEVLEAHILACLTPSVKHLILIGDHLQLRPSVAVYRLAKEKNLDVSMFERLVRSGVEHVSLQVQRRMRPCISNLVRSLYPELQNHYSEEQVDDVKGVESNLFFLDHQATESDSGDGTSKVNVAEAKLVVELCLYLLKQSCYEAKDICILTMYTAQIRTIKDYLERKIKLLGTFFKKKEFNKSSSASVVESQQRAAEGDALSQVPRVSSVDDYQGEESDIILLSLVRSNELVNEEGVGKIGFLKTSNRICVALTRARKGLFIFGNATLLAEKSTMWRDIVNTMKLDGNLGSEITLVCQNHPDVKSKICTVEGFKIVEDGGCSRACEYQLDCGHVCPRRCHPGTHDEIVCPKPCLRKYDQCVHICQSICHGRDACRPCSVLVVKDMGSCGHSQKLPCSMAIQDAICASPCDKLLACGHKCREKCAALCTVKCMEMVTKVLDCGHSGNVNCCTDFFMCREPCRSILKECQHTCLGTCGQCKQGIQHIPCLKECGRVLVCGHLCKYGCSVVCPPCPKRCKKRCFHSKCNHECGKICIPCIEPCAWRCEHFSCAKRCHETCTRPRCDFPCANVLPCQHPCVGLCGEPCPSKCRICHPKTLDIITQTTFEECSPDDRFVQLTDCGHIFEVEGLDTWMDARDAPDSNGGTTASVKLKECPECRSPVWRTHRYSNVVKTKIELVAEVKRITYGYAKVNLANETLRKGDYKTACLQFCDALEKNPGLMEAHFGAGRAFLKLNSHVKGIMHLSFIVKRSFMGSSLTTLIEDATRGIKPGLLSRFENCTSRSTDELAVEASLHWASALTVSKEFDSAIKLCEAILTMQPKHDLAHKVKETALQRQVHQIVQVVSKTLGGSGRWHKCPNGHIYCIGECGGAMEISKCPDCKAAVGGTSHRLLPDNSHSDVDGSSHPAWSDITGVGGFEL